MIQTLQRPDVELTSDFLLKFCDPIMDPIYRGLPAHLGLINFFNHLDHFQYRYLPKIGSKSGFFLYLCFDFSLYPNLTRTSFSCLEEAFLYLVSENVIKQYTEDYDYDDYS